MAPTTTEDSMKERVGFATLLEAHDLFRAFLCSGYTLWAVIVSILLMVALVSSDAWGQSRRRHRYRDRRPTTVQIVAQAQPQVAPVAPPGAGNCSNATAAAEHSGAGARALEAGNNRECIAEYQVVHSFEGCITPETRFNLGVCLQNDHAYPQALAEFNAIVAGARMPRRIGREVVDARVVTLRELIRQAAAAQQPAASPLVLCRPPQRVCGGQCVNIQTDARNCGSCGGACPAGNVCSAGGCRAVISTQPPNAGSARRRASLALMVGGGVTLAAGISFFVLGAVNSAKADEDRARLATNGCDVANTSPTCLRYAPGSSRPDELAAWQLPVGGIMTGIGALSLGVGIVLRVTGQPPPPVRPTAGLGSIGFEGTF